MSRAYKLIQIIIIGAMFFSMFFPVLKSAYGQTIPPELQSYILPGETLVSMVPVKISGKTYNLFYFTTKADYVKPNGEIFFQPDYIRSDIWTDKTGITGLLVTDSQFNPITDPGLLRQVFLIEMGGFLLHNMGKPELLWVSQGEIESAAEYSTEWRVLLPLFDKFFKNALLNTEVDRYANSLKLILATPDKNIENFNKGVSIFQSFVDAGDGAVEAFDKLVLDQSYSNDQIVREIDNIKARNLLGKIEDAVEVDGTEVNIFGRKISFLNYLDILGLILRVVYIDKLYEVRLNELVMLVENAEARGIDLHPDFIKAVKKIHRENESIYAEVPDLILDYIVENWGDLLIDEGTEAFAQKFATWAYINKGTRTVGHKWAGSVSGTLMVVSIGFTAADIMWGRDGVYEHIVMTDYAARSVLQFQEYGLALSNNVNFSPIAYDEKESEVYRQVLIFTNLMSAQVEASYANILESGRLIKFFDAFFSTRTVQEWNQAIQQFRAAATEADEKTLNTLIRPLVIEDAIIRAITRAKMGNQSLALSNTFLVVDISGSMEEADIRGGTKMDASKKAINTFLEMINAENQVLQNNNTVGLISFSNVPNLLSGATQDIWAIKGIVNGFSPGGGTTIAGGLNLANQHFQTSSQADINAIILLTDGVPTVSMDGSFNLEDSNSYQLLKQEILDGPVANAAQNNTCIHVIGLGDPNESSQLPDGSELPQIDVDLLQKIATGSGCGEYFHAEYASELVNLYVRLRHESVGNVVVDVEDTILPNQTSAPVAFSVGSGQDFLVASLNWAGSMVDLLIEDPKGDLVDSAYPGAQIVTDETSTFLSLENPAPGDWSVSVYGRDVPPEGEDFYAVVSVRGEEMAAGSLPLIGGGSGVGGMILVILVVVIGVVVVTTYSSRKRGIQSKQSQTGQAALIGHDGNTIPLHDNFIIGRGSQAHLKLQGSQISRQHAVIRFGEGAWFIQNQGQAGTSVNGAQVQATRLNTGDQITIGNYTFTFRI